MKWDQFYQKFGACPLITPKMVYALGGHWPSIQVQISRWVKGKKLIKLAREKYIFSEVYRRDDLSPIYIANQLVYPSYVSLEYALSFHGLIPEAVFSMTSLTTLRPSHFSTAVGTFVYKHIKRGLFWGYESRNEKNLALLIAQPEKALLDTFYFWRGKMNQERLIEMRFQNLDNINIDRLIHFTKKTGSKKLSRFIHDLFIPWLTEEKGEMK